MRRALLVSLSLAALGWMAGCGGSGSLGSTGGGTTPNALSGQYAFVLGGLDASGNRVSMAGSLKADGLGHITAGEVDVNDNGTPSTSNSLAGTYSFDANGQSTLGTITLTNTVGTVAHPLSFGFSLQASGNFGQIMSQDANNFIATGTMQLQTPSLFTLASLAGDYIVTLNGPNGSNPTAALGHITLGAGGSSTNVSFDRSVAGVGTAGPTTTAALTLGAAGPDSNGRGTFTFTLNDGLPVATSQVFAYYVVNANRIAAVETDANGVMTSDFSKQQNTPFSASTVITTGCVFGMSGADIPNANEATAVGQLVMTGSGAGAGALHWDANDAGIIPGTTNSLGLSVAWNPATGRGAVAVPGGNAAGLSDSVVFYLSAPGTGFILDATTGSTNRAMAGNFMPQTGAPFSAATDFAGQGIVRTLGGSVNDALSIVGLFGVTTTPGDFALLFDQRFFNGTNIETDLDQSFSGITVGTVDATIGRTTLSLPNGAGSSPQAAYIIGPNEFRFIDISTTDGASSLFFVSQR